MDDKDNANKDLERRQYRAERVRRYQARLRGQLIQAYGGACGVCGTEEELFANRQVPLPRGMNPYTGYAMARRLEFPEGLYKLFCKQHQYTWSTDPVSPTKDPALAAWLEAQNR